MSAVVLLPGFVPWMPWPCNGRTGLCLGSSICASFGNRRPKPARRSKRNQKVQDASYFSISIRISIHISINICIHISTNLGIRMIN